MIKARLIYFIRLYWAMVLIALEFTYAYEYLTGVNKVGTARVDHSPYALQFVTYAICIVIILFDPRVLKRLVQMRIFVWAFAFLTLLLWGMLLRAYRVPAGFPAYDFLRAFGLQVNAVTFLIASVLVFADASVLRHTKRAVAVATLFGAALNFYDVLHPGTFSNVTGRAAGLYVDANQSGMALVLGCLIGLTAVPRRLREVFVLIIGAAVLATFSREAMFAGALLAVGAIAGKALSTPRMLAGVMVLAVAFSAWNFTALLSQNGVLNSDTVARLSFESSDYSAWSRAHIAEKTFEQFAAAPLLGQGFGTTTYWTDIQSHDTYLSLMADFGIAGIFVIPWLIFSLRRKTWDYYTFAAIFLSWGFLLHLVLTLNYSLLSLAIEADESEDLRNAGFGPATERVVFDDVVWER